jgi:predicted DNA-binding transcriptional regulator AlpA
MEEWTAQEAADYVGVQLRTWHAYTSRGQVPAPVRHVGRTPVWDAAAVREWKENRPGRGGWAASRARVAQRATERPRNDRATRKPRDVASGPQSAVHEPTEPQG